MLSDDVQPKASKQPSGQQTSTGLVSLGHRTVEEVVFQKIRDEIITGRMKPHERLTYRELAQDLGVSVTPIRIALRELAKEGLVDVRAHAGARVAPLSQVDLEEIMVTRMGIEGWLGRAGAQHLTDKDISTMATLLEQVRRDEEAEDRQAYLRSSWAFRTQCYAAAEKPCLLERASDLYDLSTRYHYLTIAESPRLARSRHLMEEFFDACESRDGELAQRVMQGALEWTLMYVSQGLTEISPDY